MNMSDAAQYVYFGSKGSGTDSTQVGTNGVGGIDKTEVLAAWAADDPRYAALAARASAARSTLRPGVPANPTPDQVYAQLAPGAPAAGPDARDAVCYLQALRTILGL